MLSVLATLDLGGTVLAQYVYDSDNERVLKAEFQPGNPDPVNSSIYYRDEAGLVQFESTRSEEDNPENPAEPIISQAHRAYGYVLGKIAYQLDYSSGLRSSNYAQANGLNGDACTTLPGIFQPLFQLTQNGYEVVVPLNVPCQGEDIRGLTMILYEGRHEDSGASTKSQAWEEREKYVVEITLGDDIPDSVVFPNLLYDKDYRAVLKVATTANGFGWVSTDTITGGEARWNVDNDNRTPMSLVRHGEVNSFDLAWEDAADFYNVYVVHGTGERTLLTGEPLTQPGVIFDGSVLDGLDLEDGSRFEVDGISGGGIVNPLGGITGPTRPGGPGGPGGGGDQLCVFVITPECRNDPSTCRKVCTQLSRSPVEATFFHTDHLGTPRALSDEDGLVISRHDYEPFGIEIPGIDADFTHRFTGHERDSKTGLDYMHARYYGSASGRFQSVDPVGDGSNWYVYASNNPILYFDPNGLSDGPGFWWEFTTSLGDDLAAGEAGPRTLDFFIGAGTVLWETGKSSVKASVSPVLVAKDQLEGMAILAEDIGEKGLETTIKEGADQIIESGMNNPSKAVGGFTMGVELAILAGAGQKGPIFKKPPKPKTLKQQALELVSKNNGKHRVTLKSENMKLDLDLKGSAHGGVETPHMKVSPRNLRGKNQPAYNTNKTPVVPATQQYIRIVRKFLERATKK